MVLNELLFFSFFFSFFFAFFQHLNINHPIYQNIHKNIHLRRSLEVIPVSQMHATHPSEQFDSNIIDIKKPLAVILAWLSAQEKHLEKYRILWFQRGFDVLTVKMSLPQFLFPSLGAKKLINDLLNFLILSSKNYPEIILHAFSVGAYEFGEMLSQLKENSEFQKFNTKLSPNLEKNARQIISENIKGIIFDSPVATEGIASGVSRSLTGNQYLCKMFEYLIRFHLFCSYPFATKHYYNASEYAHNTFLNVPALFFTSAIDKIGDAYMTTRIGNKWKKLGIDVNHINFENSPHVQHYNKYPQEYSKQVDDFIQKLNLTKI